ncbi:MAG: hypothetical protein LC650_01735 [Actinobacteria bacterium]|nr:hypothetical protein [Actinomycetota bacterium]
MRTERSTCPRLHVGAVFSRDGRILVTGYNGAPKGLPHCEHECNCRFYQGVHDEGCRFEQPCLTAEHAERNAIAWAARNGVKLEGCEVHVTHMPCLACAMSLINAGVERVTYRNPYRILDGVNLLRQAGIEVEYDYVEPDDMMMPCN